MNSKHPFEPFIPKGAKKLIIGSIPPPRFCIIPQEISNEDVNFYYGSKDNSFWRIMQEIFNTDLQYKNTASAIEQRKELLKNLSIGITDIIDECIHINNSASDEDLKILKHKDIFGLLNVNESIETLIYTSDFVKKQINSIYKTYHTIDKNNTRKQTVKIGNKTYNVRVLFSPSPLALINMGKNGTEKRKEQYRDFLVKE